jgi:hypothetical protein
MEKTQNEQMLYIFENQFHLLNDCKYCYFYDDNEYKKQLDHNIGYILNEYKGTGYRNYNGTIINNTTKYLNEPIVDVNDSFYQIHILNNYILDIPKYNEEIILYRWLRNSSTNPNFKNYLKVGNIVPVDQFVSCGVFIENFNETYFRIILPKNFPFLFLEKSSNCSLEHTECILPYTLDKTGKTLNYGFKVLDIIENKNYKEDYQFKLNEYNTKLNNITEFDKYKTIIKNILDEVQMKPFIKHLITITPVILKNSIKFENFDNIHNNNIKPKFESTYYNMNINFFSRLFQWDNNRDILFEIIEKIKNKYDLKHKEKLTKDLDIHNIIKNLQDEFNYKKILLEF